jgi:hypothetical protein
MKPVLTRESLCSCIREGEREVQKTLDVAIAPGGENCPDISRISEETKLRNLKGHSQGRVPFGYFR